MSSARSAEPGRGEGPEHSAATGGRAPHPWLHPVVLGLVALALCALMAWIWFVGTADGDWSPTSEGEIITSVYDPPTSDVEDALNAGDGQVFAAHATDPFLRRPEVIRGGPEEQAYRLQRPGLGWLGWLTSGGSPGAVPWALVTVSVASAALLVAVVAALVQRAGALPGWSLLLLLLPGVVADVTYVGPEALGTALLLVGWHRWRGGGAVPLVALAAFAGAGLLRETLLLVPAALAVVDLARGRWSRAAALAATALPYAAWVLVLRVHLGAWPRGNVPGRLTAVPFSGLVDQAGAWSAADAAGIVLTLVLGVAGLAVTRDAGLRAVLVAHVALAAVLGWPVWVRGADVGRVLLPLAAFGLVALAEARSGDARRRAGSRVVTASPDGQPPSSRRTSIPPS